LFLKKLGNYKESITSLLSLLKKDFNVLRFKKEIFYYFNSVCQNDPERFEQEQDGERQGQISRRIKNSYVVKDAYSIKMNNEHKKWVSEFAPNIQLFERVFWKILKIFETNSDEILRNNDTWILVLKSLFGLRQHKKVSEKHYIKTYFKAKLAAFV
jgi:hypothetical protein